MSWRVSNVESFRQWEADEDAELVPLITRLIGEDEPSELMLAGTAFHKALETAPTGLTANDIGANGYTFLFHGDFEVELCTVRELRASKTYIVDGRPIVISGQVDQIEGKRIEDHKTTGRFDPERYLNGYQWRLYLDIFGADHFRWNVFEISETCEPKQYAVHDAHRLEQFRYPALAEDCQRLVERFARFVRQNIDGEQPKPPQRRLGGLAAVGELYRTA